MTHMPAAACQHPVPAGPPAPVTVAAASAESAAALKREAPPGRGAAQPNHNRGGKRPL